MTDKSRTRNGGAFRPPRSSDLPGRWANLGARHGHDRRFVSKAGAGPHFLTRDSDLDLPRAAAVDPASCGRRGQAVGGRGAGALVGVPAAAWPPGPPPSGGGQCPARGLLAAVPVRREAPVHGEQFVQRAGLGDPAAVEEQDLVGAGDGGQLVRDDQRGPPVAARLQRPDDGLLVGVVQGGGGLVEQQDRGLLEQRAGDADPLPLTAGQGRCAQVSLPLVTGHNLARDLPRAQEAL